MDYEQKYKEALERAKTYHTNKSGASLVEYIFPELKESEDEKIINRIKTAVESYWSDEPLEEILRWLEKQKPEWSEEDEVRLNDVIRLIENSGHVESIRKHYIDWLKSLRPQEQQYDDEWSDEDKEFLKLTLSNLTELKDRYGEGYGRVGECIKWLNSLQPQPIDVEAVIAYQDGYQKAELEFSQKQQEWTQEDIDMIDWLIRCCEKEHEELCNDRYGHQDIVSDLKRDCRKKWDWLESLKGKVAPQKQWKPSEEQMKAVEEALSLAKNCGEEYSFDLRKLLEQLKAL